MDCVGWRWGRTYAAQRVRQRWIVTLFKNFKTASNQHHSAPEQDKASCGLTRCNSVWWAQRKAACCRLKRTQRIVGTAHMAVCNHSCLRLRNVKCDFLTYEVSDLDWWILIISLTWNGPGTDMQWTNHPIRLAKQKRGMSLPTIQSQASQQRGQTWLVLTPMVQCQTWAQPSSREMILRSLDGAELEVGSPDDGIKKRFGITPRKSQKCNWCWNCALPPESTLLHYCLEATHDYESNFTSTIGNITQSLMCPICNAIFLSALLHRMEILYSFDSDWRQCVLWFKLEVNWKMMSTARNVQWSCCYQFLVCCSLESMADIAQVCTAIQLCRRENNLVRIFVLSTHLRVDACKPVLLCMRDAWAGDIWQGLSACVRHTQTWLWCL